MAEQRIAVTRDSGQVAFYINGCLQFDSRDEKIYHEYLVRPALELVRSRFPGPFRALVLGGGDGLATREILTAEAAERVDLVDFDAEVLAWGRSEFAALNGGALSDGRVAVHCTDAVEFLASCRQLYDLVVVDFTFPEDLAAGVLFTEKFYLAIQRCLHPDGVVALNTVSPEVSPVAYWSIYRALRNVGLGPRPYQAAIPSFLRHGYGRWGFFMGSPRPILARELRSLHFSGEGIPSRSAFLRSLRFPSGQVLFGQGCARPLAKPSDILWMLNLRLPVLPAEGEMIDFLQRDPLRYLGRTGAEEPAAMLLALSDWAQQVFLSMRSLDWDRLFRELELRMKDIPAGIRDEIQRLREEGPEALRERCLSRAGLERVLAALIVVLIVINIVYPDNAYAKGYYGHHHSGSHYSSYDDNSTSLRWTMAVAASPFRNLPFIQAGHAMVPDIKGKVHPVRKVVFLGDDGRAVEEQLAYMLADDLYVSSGGHAYYLIPDSPYFYAVGPEGCELFRSDESSPVMSLGMDPQLLRTLQDNLAFQKKTLDKMLQEYGRWLDWAGPAAIVSGGIQEETREIGRLRALQKSFVLLDQVFGNYVMPLDDAGSAVRLAPGVYLSAQDALVLRSGFGKWSCLSFRGFHVDPMLPSADSSAEMERFVGAVLQWNIQKLPAGDPLRQRLLRGMTGGRG